MTTHLHVHLEPNERKRRQQGVTRQGFGGPAQFFAEHALTNSGRLAVDMADLELFINDFHAEQRAQGVSHVELRFSPRRFLSGGTTLAEALSRADRVAAGLARPAVRLILLVNRDSPAGFIDMCQSAIASGLPRHFVGLDLAGDEVRFPDVRKFESCFRIARSAGLGVTVHAGEFGDPDNVWRALDQLGASRIGHAVSVTRCSQLARRLREDRILVEVSVTSNVALGAVPSPDSHPLPWLLEQGIPVSLNTDVPLHVGTEMAIEQRQAVRLVGGDWRVIDSLEASARRHRFPDRASGAQRSLLVDVTDDLPRGGCRPPGRAPRPGRLPASRPAPGPARAPGGLAVRKTHPCLTILPGAAPGPGERARQGTLCPRPLTSAVEDP
jgi:adenosine deaminase